MSVPHRVQTQSSHLVRTIIIIQWQTSTGEIAVYPQLRPLPLGQRTIDVQQKHIPCCEQAESGMSPVVP